MLDAGTIAELRSESEELFVELIGIFGRETPAQLAALETSLRIGDRSAAERAAHTLRGSAATLGATAMRDHAAAAESAARADDLGTVAGMVEALRDLAQHAL